MCKDTHQINWIKPDINEAHFCLKNNIKGWYHIFFYIVLFTLTGLNAFYLLHYFTFNTIYWWFGIVVLYIHCLFYSFLGWAGIGHELAHNTVFKSKYLNNFFLYITSFLLWQNCFYFIASHKKHHKFTLYNTLDKEVILPLKLSKTDWIFLITYNIPSFYRTIRALCLNSMGIIKGEWANSLFRDMQAKNQLFIFARIILLGHFILILFFISYGFYELIFIISFAPFCASWLNRIFSLSQHIDKIGEVNDFRLNSSTIRLNWFFSMLYANMNYHIEHHLFPNVPCYNLPKLSKEIKDFLPPPIQGVIATITYVIQKSA